MNPPTTSPSALKSATRIVGWALLIGGLSISLFAGSLTGLRDLSETLLSFGFPAGTLCVAGFLLLTLDSVGSRAEPFETASGEGHEALHRNAGDEDHASQSLKEIEDRIIGELERSHEGIKGELREMSALLQGKFGGDEESAAWSLAVGAEITPQQVRPGPRRLGPQPLSIEPSLEEFDEEELEMTLELEEQAPDEARLWSQHTELAELGDIEDRLTADVSVDPAGYQWDFPRSEDDSLIEELGTPEDEPNAETGPTFDPSSDTENIDWLEWDEDDLV